MITYDDVVQADPIVESMNRETVQFWVDTANVGLPDERFAHARTGIIRPGTPHKGRVLYVLHMLNVPPVDLKALYIRERLKVGTSKTYVKTPHPWDSTQHGKQLKKLVKR